MMAMMLVASATAFAGDSDALKAILKAKDYAEAQSLISSSLAQLTDASEKARAYNKLVDLAYEKFQKEDNIRTTNMVMKKNDTIASVCKVMHSQAEEEDIEEAEITDEAAGPQKED